LKKNKKLTKKDKKQKKQLREIKAKKLQKIKDVLNADREQYANSWSNENAAFFEHNGHYEWMANFLDGFKNVIEIGTGDGRGTLSLAKRGHFIISVDENPICLQMANNRLKENDINVILLTRETVLLSGSLYRIDYDKINVNIEDFDVILIEGDIIYDQNLISWLVKNGPYDAVACWLIGTHSSRGNNEYISKDSIDSSQHYRLKTQNIVYETADIILRSGGRLHIVDRGEVPESELLQKDFFQSHQDQASVTSLEVQSLDWIEYKEPESQNAIEMVAAIPISGRNPKLDKLALQSVISLKP